FLQLARPEAAEELARPEETQQFEGYDTPIEALNLSVRAYNCLKRSGLMTVGAVLEKSEEELMSLRNFGEKSYIELRDKLVEHGFPAPRVESRRPAAAPAGREEAPEERGEERPAASAEGGSEEEVGALGAALMEALREAGRRRDE